MADNDKKADTSKPTEAPKAGPKTDAGSKPGVSQPPIVIKPGSGPTDTKPAEIKTTDIKPADTGSKPQEQAPPRKTGLGSEWTASDDRGPLGRAEDEVDQSKASGSPASTRATSTGTSSIGIASPGAATAVDAKTPSGGAAGAATPTSVTGKDVAGKDSATKTDAAKSTGSAKITAVPPVDAAAKSPAKDTAGRPGTTAAASQPTPTSPPTEAKSSLWPVAAALILGAVIGAGSAALIYRGYADDSQPDPKVTELTNRVTALEKRPDPQAAIGTLKSSVTALDGQVAAIRQGRGASQAQARPAAPAAAPQAPADLDAINQKIAALQAKVDGLAPGADTKALEQKVGALQSELDQAKNSAAAAQTGVTAVQGQQKDIASRVTMPALAVVADSLVQQIDHGQPYATQVDALAALGADPAKVAILRQNAAKGVPSAPVLAGKFAPLAQPIIATANKAPPNASLGERLKSNMFSIVSIRRADDTSGTDLPSRVARIQAALAHDDVAGALDALSQLPPDAKAKAEAWGALAKQHVDAMTAARALQQDAIAALGSKKS